MCSSKRVSSALDLPSRSLSVLGNPLGGGPPVFVVIDCQTPQLGCCGGPQRSLQGGRRSEAAPAQAEYSRSAEPGQVLPACTIMTAVWERQYAY